jgi:hypothetical protein
MRTRAQETERMILNEKEGTRQREGCNKQRLRVQDREKDIK